MGMFSALPHKKNPCVTMMSALPNKKGLIPWDYTSAASILAGVMVLSTVQLQPFWSTKTCFARPETDLDTEHEEEACGKKSSESSYQWQQEAVLPVNWPQQKWKKNSKKWLWETGLQINSTIPQVNLNARADGTTKGDFGLSLDR